MWPLKAAVKVTTSMWMCCDCVVACVQSNWSGNIVACHGGAAAAAVDCGKTCWFGEKKIKGKACGGLAERGSG